MAIELIAKIKPKNNGGFPLVDAIDIEYKEGRLTDYMPIALTQEEYNALKDSGKLNPKTPYLIIEEGE